MDNITEEEKAEKILKEEEARIIKIIDELVKKHGFKKLFLTLVNMQPPSQELGGLKTELRQAFAKFEDDYAG
jgi:hypothetical protein